MAMLPVTPLTDACERCGHRTGGEARRDDDVLRGDIVDRGAAQPVQRLVDAGADDLEDVRHARLAVDGEAPDEGAADPHSAGTERDRLDDVAAALDTTVENDLDLAADRGGDRRQQPDRPR